MQIRHILLVSALLLAGAPTARACSTPANLSSMREDVLALTNAQRRQAGLPALDRSGTLQDAAQRHACDNAATLTMSHSGSDGSNLGQRLDRVGYDWRSANENIGKGFADAGRAFGWWMNSPGHRRNILSAKVSQLGVGVAVGADRRLYWVMVAARR